MYLFFIVFSNYPASIKDFNLNNIRVMKKNLNVRLDFQIILMTLEFLQSP